LSVLQFWQAPGQLAGAGGADGIGIFGGFYLVPLFALVQSRTPKPEISRVIAGNNILNAFFIVSAAVFGIVAQKVLHWSIPQFFLAIAIMNGLVALYIFTLVPEFLMRFVAWMLTHLLYRAQVLGIDDNVPDEGPALVVCNHVSYTGPGGADGRDPAADALRHVPTRSSRRRACAGSSAPRARSRSPAGTRTRR
jgi:hypothetical protein